jgi:o-succinylbenzoate synthase
MVKASWHKHTLKFDRRRGTSRGSMLEKPSWFIVLKDEESNRTGIGECGLLPGLSVDDQPNYESTLQSLVDAINNGNPIPELNEWPSIKFGLEIAKAHFNSGKIERLIANDFSQNQKPIPINGLVWMGPFEEMKTQIEEKIKAGFDCIKLKIGAIDFEDELRLLKHIRNNFSPTDIEIRVDANGAFSIKDALEKLKRLSDYHLHSIEQPIKNGQWDEMAELCAQTPLDIALDEELIGVPKAKQKKLIETIQPQAIILKPSLIGGWEASNHWIGLAEEHGAYWWLTSALESNIGLNAIAQYASHKHTTRPQGLGTGQLYTNNFSSPLLIQKGHLIYEPSIDWEIDFEK